MGTNEVEPFKKGYLFWLTYYKKYRSGLQGIYVIPLGSSTRVFVP